MKELADHPWPARNILEAGAELGWGWATVRRAKVNVGAQSFKKGHEWWWFDPVTYIPAVAPARVIAKSPQSKIFDIVKESLDAVEPWKLPPAAAIVANHRGDFDSPKRTTYAPDKSIENRSKAFALPSPQTPVPPPTREQEIPKPIEPLKPRRVHIWDSEITGTRDALISAAGFADLYTMRADIRLRQEQLHAKGLLKEELELNDLLSRVNETLEKKKRAENLE